MSSVRLTPSVAKLACRRLPKHAHVAAPSAVDILLQNQMVYENEKPTL